MMRFDRGAGLFDANGWWTSANALTAVIDNIRRSGMNSYRYALASTYDKNVNARQGQFRSEYLDDTGWWGLAWVAAHDVTGDEHRPGGRRPHVRLLGRPVRWRLLLADRPDGVSFKGAAIRGLGVLNAATGGAYDTYLRRNADRAYAADRDSIDSYGSHWAGPYTGTDHSCQHSAVDLLNAAP